MRALLLVLALTSTAAADSARECYLHDARTKVTDVGCFDDLHATEDHTYGTRVCLVRAASGRCSGVVWFWNGDPEGKPVIAYCRIGERSAHTWFVLHELLGEPDVKNYDGSWTEWGNLVGVPIQKDV